MTNYTKLIEKIAKELHDGTLKPSDLNSDLLTAILNDVRGAVADGYGKDFNNYAKSPEKKIHLNQNLYRFSAAKTYQELAKINLARQNNPNFADFKKEALKINQQYNVQYLQTEFNTANRSGAMAEKWEKIQKQKSLYPNLTYKTVKDNRVREEHRNLQDVTKPVDDPFWDKWYPPNGWHCRCYVTQTDGEVTPGEFKGNPTPGFHGNVGKSDMIFNENEHPYFVFPAEDAKNIKASFETMKIAEPDYNVVHSSKKAKLEVSTWADTKDLEANIKSAKLIVDKLDTDVKIRPHSEIVGVKNPEYLVYGKIGDRKAQLGKGVTSNLASAKAQKCKVVVFDIQKEYPYDSNRLKNNIKGIIKQFYNKKTFETIIIVNGDAVERIEVSDWYQ